MYNDEVKSRALEIVSDLDELIRQLRDANAPDEVINALEAAMEVAETIND